MRVAVMQPYFYPYMGYFRLIAAADLFVLFDCVQFPRRGRVHRCEMAESQWLTLPLARQARDTKIADLQFADGARATLDQRCAPYLAMAGPDLPAHVSEALKSGMTSVMAYLEANLRACCQVLGITTPIQRSSDLGLSPDLRQAERVRAAAMACGATHYVNAPGGRALYAPEFFARAGMTLEFLSPYPGPHYYMLPALASVSVQELARDAAAYKVEPA